jgi:hypothetical protein
MLNYSLQRAIACFLLVLEWRSSTKTVTQAVDWVAVKGYVKYAAVWDIRVVQLGTLNLQVD